MNITKIAESIALLMEDIEKDPEADESQGKMLLCISLMKIVVDEDDKLIVPFFKELMSKTWDSYKSGSRYQKELTEDYQYLCYVQISDIRQFEISIGTGYMGYRKTDQCDYGCTICIDDYKLINSQYINNFKKRSKFKKVRERQDLVLFEFKIIDEELNLYQSVSDRVLKKILIETINALYND
jgi:hypothetical protein